MNRTDPVAEQRVTLASPEIVRLGSGMLTLMLGGLQAVMPLSTDLYLPGLPAMADDLRVTPGAAQLTLAVFMIGVAVGQVAYGPITDKFGRKKPLAFGLTVYLLASILCALAPSIGVLVLGRFLQALGASASAVIAQAIVRDLWSGKALADRLSLLVLVMGSAPLLAPSIGGLILTQTSWHGLFWFLAAFGGLGILIVTLLPETSSSAERAQTRLRSAATTYAALLRNAPFLFPVLTGGCMVGVLFAYITGSPFLYMDTLGVSSSTFAVLFSVTALGFVGLSQLNRLLLRRLSLLTIARGAIFTAVFLTLVLMAVQVSGRGGVYVYTVLLFALSATVSCTLPNVAAVAFGMVTQRMGSASAVQGTMQSIFGGISGALVGAISNGSTFPMFGVMTGFALLATVFLLASQRLHPEVH